MLQIQIKHNLNPCQDNQNTHLLRHIFCRSMS